MDNMISTNALPQSSCSAPKPLKFMPFLLMESSQGQLFPELVMLPLKLLTSQEDQRKHCSKVQVMGISVMLTEAIRRADNSTSLICLAMAFHISRIV